LENQKEEVSKYRRISRFVLIGLLLVLSFLGYRATQLEFDYDFEKFFPEADENLSFYQNYRETFENDNDFTIVSITNEQGIYQADFLKEVQLFTEELRKLPHLREVISPLEMTYFKPSGIGIGLSETPYFHVDNPDLYATDSLTLVKSKEPVKEMISFEGKSLIIIVKNIQFISKEKSDELASEMNELAVDQTFDATYLMGKIIGQKAYIDIMKVEFLTFAGISIAILIIFLIVAYRSWWGVIIPLATVLLSVIGSLGFMQLSGTPLNMMTTLLPVIMLVVGMSDVVHLVSKYLEEIRYRRTKLTALKNMLKKVGVATLLTSVTTALGFITLIGVRMQPIRDFGVFTAIGVLLAFIISIAFIPAIFMLLKKPVIVNAKRVQNQWERGLGKLFLWLCRNRKKVLLTYFFITLISIYGATKIQFDYFLMQDLSEEQPLMKEMRFFQKNFGGIRPFELAVIPKGERKLTDYEVMREMEKLENYLDTVYQVNQLVSPTFPYKLMNQAFRNGKSEYFKIPESEKRYEFLQKQMQSFGEREEWSELMNDERNLGRIFGRLVDPGSREMLIRNDSLEAFYQRSINSDIIEYKLTGTPVIIDESGRSVSLNVILGLLLAFGLIALFMGLLFRSIKMAFISIIPNVFPILLTAAYIGFAGIDLNMSSAIVFTIAFGIAVDDTIHFLSRYRQEMKLGRSRLFGLRRTFISTGKAIIITTIILLGGFGSLLFSDFLSTFYIGLFVSMTLIFAVVTDLTLLPLLLLGKKKNRLSTSI
tara:strand:- start:1515 stop:3809 length:2295 start_codon:yes stop_codon:yes gene_type:complete